MRTLFLTPFNPYPAVSGGQKVSLAQLKSYAQYGPVDLVAFYEQKMQDQEAEMRAGVKELCAQVDLFPIALHFRSHLVKNSLVGVRSLIGSMPFRLRKFVQPQVIDLLRTHSTRRYDLIHCDLLPMSTYLRYLPGVPVILSAQNAEWEVFERYGRHGSNPLMRIFSAYEARRLRHYEVAQLNRVDQVIVMSERDRTVFRAAGVTAPLTVMPFPVEPNPVAQFHQGRPTIISLGNLAAPGRAQGTLWFYREVWPQLRRLLPGVRWHIVGIGAGSEIQAMHNGDDLIVHGFLSDEALNRLLPDVQLCVVPLFIGGGVRIKIVDMLSLGIPCVGTAVGAQGFSSEAVRVQDDPAAFAQECAAVLANRDLWYHLSAAGVAYVREHHSQAALQATIDPVIAAATDRSRRVTTFESG